MLICSSSTQLFRMLFLSHTIDLTINHAVMSMTSLQINANDKMMSTEILVKDPILKIDSAGN